MTDEELYRLISLLEPLLDKLKSEQRKRVYMADITKCNDTTCPNKSTCYRFTAQNHPIWESYFAQSPKSQDGTCSMYWGNSSQQILETLKNILKDGDKI